MAHQTASPVPPGTQRDRVTQDPRQWVEPRDWFCPMGCKGEVRRPFQAWPLDCSRGAGVGSLASTLSGPPPGLVLTKERMSPECLWGLWC